MPTAARSRRHGALRSLLSVLLVASASVAPAVVQAAINPATPHGDASARMGTRRGQAPSP